MQAVSTQLSQRRLKEANTTKSYDEKENVRNENDRRKLRNIQDPTASNQRNIKVMHKDKYTGAPKAKH